MQESGPCQASGTVLLNEMQMHHRVSHCRGSSLPVCVPCLGCAAHRQAFWQKSESLELREFSLPLVDREMLTASGPACVRESNPLPTDRLMTSLTLSQNNNKQIDIPSNSRQVNYTHMPVFTKKYKLVLAKGGDTLKLGR